MSLPDPISDINFYVFVVGGVIVVTLVFSSLLRFNSRRRRANERRPSTRVRARGASGRHERIFTPRQPASESEPGVSLPAGSEDELTEESATHEAPIQKERPPSTEVEFYVLFPRLCSNKQPFSIYVCIDIYKPPAPNEKIDETAIPESLVAPVPNDSEVTVTLHSNHLRIDVPAQSFVWSGRAALASFVVHPTALKKRSIALNKILIAVDGLLRGSIEFEIEIDPNLRTSVARPAILDRDRNLADSLNHQIGHLLTTEGSRALAIRDAFICYSHKDWSRVSNTAEALEAAGINVWIDALAMKRQPHWKEQARGFIEEADIAYVFWSATAAKSGSILEELDMIQEKRDRQENGTFDSIWIRLDDEPVPSQYRFDQDRYSKRWQLFRTGMRAGV